MIKKIIFVSVSVLFLFACSRFMKLREENFTKELSRNLIENGDFEFSQATINKEYPGWIFDKIADDKVSIDSTRSFTGSKSLKISQPSKEIQLVSKPFETHFRNVYGIRLSAKSVLREIPITIHFLTFSDTGKIISKYYRNIIVGKKWETYSLVSDYLRVNSEFGRVFITIPQNDSVLLIDNISCYIIDSYQKK